MSRILCALILFFLFNASVAQNALFIDTLNFSSGMPSYFVKDTSQANNLWQVGPPQKIHFDSAWSNPNALVTDTVNPFPPGNISSFVIQLHIDTNPWTICIGEGWINFRHAYDFDSLLAGGYIEIRYADWIQGGWTPWENVAQDPYPMWFQADPGQYPVDTIVGGIPAYTGRSFGWKYAQYYWFWMAMVKGGDRDIFTNQVELRFTSMSDSTASPSDGWMIDDMDIYLLECTGSVEEPGSSSFYTRPAPNPGAGDIRILCGDPLQEAMAVKVFDGQGALIESAGFQPGEEIILHSSQYPGGHYLYRIVTASGRTSEGKFIKL